MHFGVTDAILLHGGHLQGDERTRIQL